MISDFKGLVDAKNGPSAAASLSSRRSTSRSRSTSSPATGCSCPTKARSHSTGHVCAFLNLCSHQGNPLMEADRWAQAPSGDLNGGCEAAP